MIEFIQGKIEELTPTQAVLLTAGGVAYDLNISIYTYSAIQGKDEARLFVYEAIREDAYILCGFSGKQERELFLMLISVPGIGGASARMILSSFSPSELIGIVSSGNDSLLKKVKGIGAKTAQRIIVDRESGMFRGELTAVCRGTLEAVSQEDGSFLGFEVKGGVQI